MTSRSCLRTAAVILLVVFLAPTLPVVAQRDPRDTEAAPSALPEGTNCRVAVRVIAGRLVTRCEISTKFRRIPANVMIDFDNPCGLQLHNQAAAPIGVDREGGVPIHLHFPGAQITVARRELGDQDFYDEFTKLYSKELGETALVGTIGSEILEHYHVSFDLHAGFITLEAPHAKTSELPAEIAGSAVVNISIQNNIVWLPITIGEQASADRVQSTLGISTVNYDTIVDEDFCFNRKKPAGDIGVVTAGLFDLSKYVAFRPEPLAQVNVDGVLGMFGVNLLESFRVEIDRVNQWARLTPTQEAEFPTADLEYFQARVDEEPEPLLAYLEKHKLTRLAREAAELLLDLLLESGAEAAEYRQAIEWIDKTRIEDLKSTEALKTVKGLLEAGEPQLAIVAGEIGVESGRKDRYAESVHKLHGKLGEIILEHGDPRTAWEHLLSAAFGIPEDGMVNLHLGRFYEQEAEKLEGKKAKGRLRRAFSRYIQAVIQPESGPQAVEALERLQRKLGDEDLSVDKIDRMISGKVYNFGAATQFKATDENSSNRVVLAELFTSPHLKRFGVGGALGAEGLLSHFDREHVAVLSYHLQEPRMAASVNELGLETAKLYGVSQPAVFMFDGRERGPGAARSRQADEIYEALRELAVGRLSRSSNYEIDLTATVRDGRIQGHCEVRGPDQESLNLQLIVAERGVLYPGDSKVVVHRMLARASLTDELFGVPLARAQSQPDGEESESVTTQQSFDVELADIRARNEAYLDKLTAAGGELTSKLSTKLDPRQLSVVAIVRDRSYGTVYQSRYVEAKVDDTKKE